MKNTFPFLSAILMAFTILLQYVMEGKESFFVTMESCQKEGVSRIHCFKHRPGLYALEQYNYTSERFQLMLLSVKGYSLSHLITIEGDL